MKVEKVYISTIGKLYKEVQDNAHLDKAVTALYNTLEFEIKTGERLPINIKAEEVRELSSKDIDYVQNSLYALGCKGQFIYDVSMIDSNIEYVLEDLIWNYIEWCCGLKMNQKLKYCVSTRLEN